ncbi:MAG: glutaredoxin family protein [Candidatus Nanohaloarchaea archaeon]
MKEDIEVFTTPSCPYCTRIKQWLEENGYDYIEHNVAEDREKAKEMVEKTGQRGVPQTLIGDTAVVGFQSAKIEQAIEKQGA